MNGEKKVYALLILMITMTIIISAAAFVAAS